MAPGSERGRARHAAGRVEGVANAIASIPFVYSSAAASTYVLIDHLLFLADGPSAVDLSYQGGAVHSSLPARERLIAEVPSGIGRSVGWTDGEISLTQFVAPGTKRHGALRSVFDRLRAHHRDSYVRLLDRLYNFVEQRQRANGLDLPLETQAKSASGEERPTLDAAALNEGLGPFRTSYDRILGKHEVAGSLFALQPSVPGARRSVGSSTLGLVASIRYVPFIGFQRKIGDGLPPYEYSVRHLVTGPQLFLLEESRTSGERAAAQSQSARPLVSRLTDVALGSGHVALGHLTEGGTSAVEAQIAGCITGIPAAVHVPIHVGGTPWLALAWYSHQREWESLLRFYQFTVPLLADELRSAAKEAFLERLVSHLREALKGAAMVGAAELDSVNRAWLMTSMLYPFEAPFLLDVTARSQPPDDPILIGDRTLCLDDYPSRDRTRRPMPAQVDYEPLAERVIAARCREALAELNQVRLARLDAEIRAWSHQVQSHEISTHELAHDLEEVLKVLRVAEWSRQPALEDLAAAVRIAQRLAWGLFGKPWLQRRAARARTSPQRTGDVAWSPAFPTQPDLEFWFRHFALLASAILYAKTAHLGDGGPQITIFLSLRGHAQEEKGAGAELREVSYSIELHGGAQIASSFMERSENEAESLTFRAPTPWPIPSNMLEGALDRDGLIAVLHLGAFELIRNAVESVVKTLKEVVRPRVEVTIQFDPIRRTVRTMVTNPTDPNYRGGLDEAQRKLHVLTELFPNLTTSLRYDRSRQVCIGESTLLVTAP